MIDTIIKGLYVFNKFLVVAAGVYIMLAPPFTWVGSLSSGSMIIAAIVSIYAIIRNRIRMEFVSLWFVLAGIGSYVGFVWGFVDGGDGNVTRASVASMAFVLLIARALTIWRDIKRMAELERRIEDHG